MCKEKNNMTGLLLSMVAGATFGAAIGLLFAPNSGKDTRKKIKSKAEDIKDQAKNKYEEVADKVKESYSNISSGIKDTADNIAEKVSQGYDQLTSKTNEAGEDSGNNSKNVKAEQS